MDRKISILIVDDLKENRLTIKIALKNENYIFYEAVNGEEAIKICKELKPDVILMDAIMPLLDGFDATNTIRKMEEFKHISILMITSLNHQDDKIKALKCGVNDFISKPFDKQELIARCKSYAQLSIDIYKRKEAEQELEKQHEYLQHIIDSIKDPIMAIKEDYSVSLMNKVVKDTLSNKRIADVNNPKCYEISHNRSSPCDGVEHPCPLQIVLERNCEVKVIHNHSDTTKKYIELSAVPFLDIDKKCIGIIESGRDITAHVDTLEKLNEQKTRLDYQAHHDALTGLTNRILFEDRLNIAILKVKRNKTKVAIFFIDLDKFKPINDKFGHKAGDFVLKTVAQRVQKMIRKEDTLSRIGGDEFTIIMENIINVDDIIVLSEKIIDVINKPINFQGKILTVSASIGVSISPDDSIHADTLLKYADDAMYLAKENGRNRVVLYSNTK